MRYSQIQWLRKVVPVFSWPLEQITIIGSKHDPRKKAMDQLVVPNWRGWSKTNLTLLANDIVSLNHQI